MGLTTNPNDPDLGHGIDEHPIEQHKKYLVLSDEERHKGFVRPYRDTYRHVGIKGPTYPLSDLTEEQKKMVEGTDWTKYEKYPDGSSALGRYWSQKELDQVGKGCNTVTTMGIALAETYAREPGFYGATYCVRCKMHRPVGEDGEFVWEGTDIRVGT